MFYVYEWYIVDTEKVIYVGKGKNNRYKVRKHNKQFNSLIKQQKCESRIVKQFSNEQDAFLFERELITKYQNMGEAQCNISQGGVGGTDKWWTPEKKAQYSSHNVMRRPEQRERMALHNPMKNKETALKVGKTKWRAVVIKGKLYNSVSEASKLLGVYDTQVSSWCKRGYDNDKTPCWYADEGKRNVAPKITNSKAVLVDNKKFPSVKSAAEYLQVWSETLIRAIKNNRRVKGHICKYDNQQPSREKSGKSISEGSTTNG